MTELSAEDREDLKESVRRAVVDYGRGRNNRRAFKKKTLKSIRSISMSSGYKLAMLERAATKLIDELWKEVCNESTTTGG